MRLRPAFLSLAFVAAAAACAATEGSSGTGTAEDEAAIRAMADDWAAKYNARDAAGIAAMMSSDYHEVAATGEHLASPAEAQAILERDMAQMPAEGMVSVTTDFVSFLDADDAMAGGTWSMTGMPEGGPTRGSWLVVFSKDSAGWKMRAGMGSTDMSFMMPPPAEEGM
mgnify:CR=1 FL=1